VSRAANNAFAGRMRPAGREFETPGLGSTTATITTTTMTTTLPNQLSTHYHNNNKNYYYYYYYYYYIVVASVGCGGEYSSRSGVITSANYPHSYPRRSDCIWHITVEPLHQVVLTFNDFDIENSTGCRFDYLAVRKHTSAVALSQVGVEGNPPPR